MNKETKLTSESKVDIILDSLIPYKNKYIRVTTFELYYPRIVHAELMTHRVFSRNASSSRAIPLKKMLENHANYIPMNWREHQAGMQPKGIIENKDVILDNNEIWKAARKYMIIAAEGLKNNGVAKEQYNRLLEPFSFIKVLVTATSYDNYFNLRCHKDAQFEIQEFSEKMQYLYHTHEPTIRHCHLPYINANNHVHISNNILTTTGQAMILYQDIKRSVARSARTSYATHDNKEPEDEKDFNLFKNLIASEPKHASPAEHQVLSYKMAKMLNKELKFDIKMKKLNGNLHKGVVQFRKMAERTNKELT